MGAVLVSDDIWMSSIRLKLRLRRIGSRCAIRNGRSYCGRRRPRRKGAPLHVTEFVLGSRLGAQTRRIIICQNWARCCTNYYDRCDDGFYVHDSSPHMLQLSGRNIQKNQET